MTRASIVVTNTVNDLKSTNGRLAALTQATLLFFLVTLTLTSGTIQQYLAKNLDQMLGADMVIEAHTPLAPRQVTALGSKAAALSVTQLANVTLTHNSNWERVQLKLIDGAYPLQGQLMTGQTPASLQTPAISGPPVGEIWLGPRLASKLGIWVGEQLTFGPHKLFVSAILFHEPDRIMEGHSVALRAMMHRDTLAPEDTLISKSKTRYLLQADRNAQAEIEAWAPAALPGTSVLKKYGGQHPLAGFWKRTENFLGLASVILFFMGAVATDMTNRRWVSTMMHRLALYSSFGVTARTGMALAGAQWLAAFAVACLIGLPLAAIGHSLIVGELQSFFPGLTPVWTMSAFLKTTGLVFCLLLALQVPAVLRLRSASLLTLIRHTDSDESAWPRLIWGLVAISGLAWAYSDNMLLTALTLGAVAGALVVMIIVSWTVLRLGDYWGAGRPGLLPFAFFIMRRRLFSKSAQILGLGLCGLMVLFTLMLMRDLGGMMERYSRQHDGNLLISDAQGQQKDALEQWAEANNGTIRQLRPYLRAQLVKINGVSLSDHSATPSDTMATVQSPIRLSWADSIPPNNRLTGGTWWAEGTENWQQISAEPEVMTDLGLSYGDTLTYLIEGASYDFELVASHAFKPGGSSITFWFQVPLGARKHIEATTRYMGSMELPEEAWAHLSGLWQQYPDLALVPLKELTDRFDKTLAIVTRVTSGYAAMVLLLALFVVAASVSGFRADDRKKNGLLMSMGLKDRDCLKLNLYDWTVTALIAALGAIVGTWFAGILIYDAQFGLSYNPDPFWVAGVAALMVTLVCSIGYLACRQSLKVSVRDLLNA